ncbi:MAG: hypothetical protein ACFFAI_09990 [Promethearchaeota archaeon]
MVLDIYSGRPNPKWQLKIDNINDFKSRFKDLQESEPLEPPGLGYRGFIIKNINKIPDVPMRFTVYNNVISFIKKKKRIYQEDKNKLEEWLLSQAVEHGYEKLVESIRSLKDMEKKNIKQERRKFIITKSIELGAIEGEFSIAVSVENKGNVELGNIIIKDIIPSSFNLTEFTPSEVASYEITQIGDQSELFVNIAEIKANSSVIIKYNLSGSGDYRKLEPVVIILGKDEETV